ncbi:MAG: biotin/lipoyl-binding protein [Caldilineaceae bacterium]
MYISKRWLLALLILVALGGGGYFFFYNTQINAQEGATTNTVGSATDKTALTTITIQPANAVLDDVSASGHIALVDQLVVGAEVGGKVQAVNVKVGNQVAAGDLLLTLDSIDLERALRRAELTVEAQRNALAQLTEAATASEIAVAEANLAEAKQNLADVMAGPSAAEIAAARSNLSAAWSKYNELQAGPTQAELTQLSADLKKSEVALAEAQRAYDKVVWRNDVGMTSEAAALQDATIDYEKSKAAYEVSVAAADNSEVQSAIGLAQSAQVQLDDLLNSPTEAEIAQAQAQVADAEAALADLQQGPSATELRSSEISLEQALIDLEEAHATWPRLRSAAPV